MEEQEKTKTGPSTDTSSRTDLTQVGQALRQLATTATRQLPQVRPPEQVRPAAPLSAPLRERIASLVAALGDTTSPMHQQAVNDLVVIGDPAVPALNESLNPRRSWLTAYRAAEALGQIGDGRATGPLIEALRHPNSNVRWSAVRALAALGDARALLDLRRVAREDRSKTSWGESVSGAAESALDQMRAQNVLLRGTELLKTAVACVLMLVGLILAYSVVVSVRSELATVGTEPVPTILAEPTTAATAQADTGAAAVLAETATAEPAAAEEATATAAPTEVAAIGGRVLRTANVRGRPSSQTGEKIGTVSEGDEIVFVATTQNRDWYLIRLGENRSGGSRIESSDGTGWVIGSVLSKPETSVPVQQP